MPPTHNPGMCPDRESNRRLFGLLDDAQPTEPHQLGWVEYIYKVNTMVPIKITLLKICINVSQYNGEKRQEMALHIPYDSKFILGIINYTFIEKSLW